MAALSYGELAAMMPKAGGQYVYLREAFSPLWGFLYGWTLFLVIQTGTIAAVAVAFGRFLGVLWPGISESTYIVAPIHVSTAVSLIDSLLVTGFPYTVQQKLEELVGLFAVFLSRSRAVRRLGSAALDICYVAAGRMDGFWEQGLNAWDIAAGVLLVQEAGGTVTDLDGGPFDLRSGRIIATNGRIHNELQDVIREYYRGRSQ